MFTDQNENFDFTQTCRLCLNQSKLNEFSSIFDISSFELKYSIIVNEFTGLKISEDDELPKIICLECVECLNNFYQFRKLVVNSEHRLHNFINKLQNNLNKDLLVEIINNIKEEKSDVDFPEEPNIIKTCFIDTNRDPLGLEQEPKIENKIDINEIKLENNENETLTSIISNPEKSNKNETLNVCVRNDTDNEITQVNFTCKPNPQTFTEEIDLKNFEEIQQNPEQNDSTSLSLLVKPKKFDTNEVRCKICNKCFYQKSNLKTHERIHTGEKPYKCDQCEKSFTHLSSLIGHKKRHKGEKPFICDQCGKSFMAKYDLLKHMRIHTGEKLYNCEHCGKSFSQMGFLKEHEKIHTGKKSFICDQCGKPFLRLSQLRLHKRTHTGEKPYSCTDCGKSFTNSSGLIEHKRTHTGEKPFKCDQCEKSFTVSSNLKGHKRIHTGEKPYSCKHCGQSFTLAGNLRVHEKTHEGI